MLFIFWTTLTFFLSLWIINPGNYFVAAGFIGLIIVYYYRTKDFRKSLLLAYLASTIVFTGKRYPIELIPPGIIPKEIFPEGYMAFFVISPKHILASLMVFVWLRDLIRKGMSFIKVTKVDLLVLGFFLLIIISGFFGSKRPDISSLFDFLGLHTLIFYFYLRTYIAKYSHYFLALLIGLFAALILFESLISFQQFIAGSPIYKSIEVQVDIELFGRASDEQEFAFRPVGTFEHANILGMWLSFWLIVLFSYLYKNSHKLYWLVTLFGIVTLVMSLSRSAWLGFGIGTLYLLYGFEKIKKIKPPQILAKNSWVLLLAALILFAFFVLPRTEKSLYTLSEGGGAFRFLQIEETIGLIRQNPLFGVGTLMSVSEGLAIYPLGIYSTVALSVHNWYLLIAAENGLSALVIFMVFLIISLRKNILSFLKHKLVTTADHLKLGFLGGVLSLMIVGLFQPFIGEILILLSFAIMGQDS